MSNVQIQQCNFTFPIFHFSHRGAVLVLVLEGGAFEVQMKSPHSHPTMPSTTLHYDDDDNHGDVFDVKL